MTRGNRRILALAAVCALAASCAGLGRSGARTGSSTSSTASTAIALSVSTAAIYLVDPGTGGRQRIGGRLTDFQAGSAAWAPDHRRLAYGNGGIVVANAQSRRSRVLVRGQSLSMPAWSTDGRRLVYGDGTGMWLTGVRRRGSVAVPLPNRLAPLGMAWNPGRVIAFQGLELDCTQAFGCSSTERSEIWTVRADGSELRRVTRVGHAEKPKWSPDGSRILFVVTELDKPTRPRTLWSVRVDANDANRLIRARNVVAADWSPDGKHLVVVRRHAEDHTLSVWVADSDGSGIRPIGEPFAGNDATVDW